MQQQKRFSRFTKCTLLILISAFFVHPVFVCSSFGQNNLFKSGFLLGPTLSQVHGDGIGGFNKVGINAGAFVSMDLSEKTSLGFEMYYVNKGSRKPPKKHDPYFWAIRLNYIEIPVVFSYRYKKYSAELGLSYGRLINQKFLNNGIAYTPPSNRVFKKNEFAGFIGLRYQWKPNLSFSGRISRSLLYVRDYTATLPRYNPYNLPVGTTNFVVNLSIYYHFGTNRSNET